MILFLTPFFQYIFSFLLSYKYFGLFAIALVSSIALPIPASMALSAAGGFASQGYFNIYLIMLVTVIGSMLGDIIGYFLAKRYGEEVLNKSIFFRHLLQSQSYHKVKDYIVDFAPSLIFFSRFLTELSPATNVLAGLSRVRYRTFIIFALLGEVAYTILYSIAGFVLGAEWENNVSFIFKAGAVILSLGIFVNLIQVYLYEKRKKKS